MIGRILRWGSLQLCQSLVNGLYNEFYTRLLNYKSCARGGGGGEILLNFEMCAVMSRI